MNFQASGMEAFEYSALPARVIFGFGTVARVTGELLALGRKRPSFFPIHITQPQAQRASCAHWASWVSTFRPML